MPWNIIWTEKAKKDLEKLDKNTAKRIYEKIIYANTTGLLFLEKVEKIENIFKYRVGNYRVLITKINLETISVLAIRHRKNVYKNI